MRDFNFFEPYLNKNTNFSGKTGKYLVVVGAMTLLALYPLYNGIQIYKANSEVATVGGLVQSSSIQEGKQLMEKLTNQRKALVERKEKLVGVEEIFRGKDVINDLLIFTINDHIPEDVFLESVKISAGQILIQGVSKDQKSIALLDRNLRRNEAFKDVFISSIIGDLGSYTFTVSFSIKGGDEE
ncbi:PilN domain-containing protein [Alkaliphilus hydrothermalis]|uniref:Tfp pilus assembly protein PilN n=1 Tax=Alkaliphilus hydrothermalis TaxID=1482730 RepID=A0ABS2NM17_9FIRM|nr:PilN domain-containing protein [Alkaliphilus hydrothermalis]MBM7613987.1 Tfp pilus assembly protein PilN [Alkaliphilus hydrothermalis]